ncbi:hypothetical protein WA026_019442 [Henosepilachna vigintioctopunctata]|uniref:Uncharacterized protein n=1 Tax=Henosepilachna vigintioctopunctata TaxID=420089 RepID=A0AAW1UAN3_9CUCU
MTSDADRDITLRKIYEEIISSKQEVKNTITASEARLLLEIQELKIRVNALEEENSELKNNIEFAERNLNKKNLVIFGLKKSGAEISLSYVCKDYLMLKLQKAIRQREELHGLKKHLLKARVNSSKKSFIRGNELFVGEEEYTLKERERDIEDHQSNGAPLAPQPKGKKGQDDNDENFRRDNGTQYDVRRIHVHRTQTNQPLQQNLKILRCMKLIWFQGWE